MLPFFNSSKITTPLCPYSLKTSATKGESMKLFISTFFTTLVLIGIEGAFACQIPPCPGWPTNRPKPPAPPLVSADSHVKVEATEDGAAIVIRGAAADQMYSAMTDVRASRKTKTGQQVSCTKVQAEAQCVLEMGSRGEVFDNE